MSWCFCFSASPTGITPKCFAIKDAEQVFVDYDKAIIFLTQLLFKDKLKMSHMTLLLLFPYFQVIFEALESGATISF